MAAYRAGSTLRNGATAKVLTATVEDRGSCEGLLSDHGGNGGRATSKADSRSARVGAT